MFQDWATARSMGTVTFCSTVWGEAPGMAVPTMITGTEMLGKRSTGMRSMATLPSMTRPRQAMSTAMGFLSAERITRPPLARTAHPRLALALMGLRESSGLASRHGRRSGRGGGVRGVRGLALAAGVVVGRDDRG